MASLKPLRAEGPKALLEELVAIEGIHTAVVVGRDGFVIENASSRGAGQEAEAIGAVISAGIGSGAVMGAELKLGEMSQSMFEYEGGVIIMCLASAEAILAVVADLKANLGNVRYQVKKRLPALAQSL